MLRRPPIPGVRFMQSLGKADVPGMTSSQVMLAVADFLNAIFSQRQAYEMLFFLIGSVDYASWTEVAACLALSIVGVIALTGTGRALDAASFGDEHAKALGVRLGALRAVIFLASSLMIGASVAAAGMIGFVGLFVPHSVRLIFGAEHRTLIPASALIGAAFLMLADSLARSSIVYKHFGGELPVGVITALIGAPFFFWLMNRKM